MNNFYGWAMSNYLHYERFKWLKNIDEFEKKVRLDLFLRLILNIL